MVATRSQDYSCSAAYGEFDSGMIDPRSGIFVIPFHNINNFVSLKLNSTNYLLWRDQIESIFITTDLLGYVDGEFQEPPKISKQTGLVSNEWIYWRKADRFVMNCLKQNFSETIVGDVYGMETSREIWLYLETSFRS